ncbi:hypothetical protein JAAARDRAFT_68638 [Jaapia argillacea MUCL 33604]|uniref:Uncharacterized protein n=1 Tax=Jaapia argillacea MUCL 33604 TaxID=933084 RepID=A0A067PW78_9AGAM|nr:hypothetical protein JAAARDRAFT_68638 [Jaapia argillacea MUCL 33604]
MDIRRPTTPTPQAPPGLQHPQKRTLPQDMFSGKRRYSSASITSPSPSGADRNPSTHSLGSEGGSASAQYVYYSTGPRRPSRSTGYVKDLLPPGSLPDDDGTHQDEVPRLQRWLGMDCSTPLIPFPRAEETAVARREPSHGRAMPDLSSSTQTRALGDRAPYSRRRARSLSMRHTPSAFLLRASSLVYSRPPIPPLEPTTEDIASWERRRARHVAISVDRANRPSAIPPAEETADTPDSPSTTREIHSASPSSPPGIPSRRVSDVSVPPAPVNLVASHDSTAASHTTATVARRPLVALESATEDIASWERRRARHLAISVDLANGSPVTLPGEETDATPDPPEMIHEDTPPNSPTGISLRIISDAPMHPYSASLVESHSSGARAQMPLDYLWNHHRHNRYAPKTISPLSPLRDPDLRDFWNPLLAVPERLDSSKNGGTRYKNRIRPRSVSLCGPAPSQGRRDPFDGPTQSQNGTVVVSTCAPRVVRETRVLSPRTPLPVAPGNMDIMIVDTEPLPIAGRITVN